MYGHFKAKTFAHACQEINTIHDMDLRFEEIKKSRKVVAIRFSFKPVVINHITDQNTGITKNQNFN
jgi:plasmid replication initiation protein